jgi:uncharacterized membrane protein
MSELDESLDSFENRLRRLEAELVDLRALAAQLERKREPEPPLWELLATEAEQPAVQPALPPPVEPPPVFREPRPPFDWSALLGARTLAWTGGVVTLLGIVFFFVLSVERGWIGPGMRVALGAAASTLVLGTGIWLHRRFGATYASLSAAGAGVAGFYTTLIAATVLYDLVSPPVALGLAAVIATVGTSLAVVWRSETLASIGIAGAMLAPVPIAIQDGHLSAAGTAFAALMFASAALVTIPRRWPGLYVGSVLASAPQAVGLVADHRPHAAAVAAAFWFLYAAGGLWMALRERLTYLPASLLLSSGVFGGFAAGLLYDGTREGIALLVVAVPYVLAAVALYRRDRDSASVLTAIGLAVAAVAAASLTSGTTLTIVWAAEAVVLAWLARRIAEPRFQLASLVWLALAYVHAVAIDAPPSRLFVENNDAWRSVPSVAALAIATGAAAFATFDWKPRAEGIFAPVFSKLRDAQPQLRQVELVPACIAGVYAASLGVVTLPEEWSWGHVAVAGLWSAVAATLSLVGYRRGALAAAGAAVALVVLYDLPTIDEIPRSWAFAIVALSLLIVAVVHDWRSKASLDWSSVAAVGASVALAAAWVVELLDGHARGAALLALAGAYGLVGVSVLHRRRDLASALGIAALLLAVPASDLLVHGSWLVLAWISATVGLALLARFEERLFYGSFAYLGLAFLHTYSLEAKPRDLFVAQAHPGAGVPAVLFVAAGVAVLAWRRGDIRTFLCWVCGGLCLYAATLAILEASEEIGGSVHTAFQRGHTAVSFVWGAVGLALLVAGLKRGGRNLRVGGFALFGVSLAKLFVYDLAFLSSVARAVSFLAVGAVILVGGFFYQRLALDSRM